MDIAEDDLESEETEPLPPFFFGGSIGGGGRPGKYNDVLTICKKHFSL
jgi:hypothetical protein